MKRLWSRILGAVCFFLYVSSANATTITFDVVNISGNTFEYSYTVHNDSLAVDIEEFTIFFDVNSSQNLSMPGAPAGWDPLVIQPDFLLPDDGFYDALALVAGIAPGAVVGEFTVRADFVGAARPGAQRFEILDPFSFALLDSGVTVRAGAAAVPEAAGIWIMALGLLAMTAIARRPTVGRSADGPGP